jgi:hypothetical protein
MGLLLLCSLNMYKKQANALFCTLITFPALQYFDTITDFEKQFFCSFRTESAAVSNTKSHNGQCYFSASQSVSQSVRPSVRSFVPSPCFL